MFFMQCWECGQRWGIGESRTCTCPDEEPKRDWVGLTNEEKEKFVVAYYPSTWDRKTAVSLMNAYEEYLKEKNHV